MALAGIASKRGFTNGPITGTRFGTIDRRRDFAFARKYGLAIRQVVQQADVEGRVTTVVPGVGYLIMAANSMWYRNLMASYSLVMVTAYLVRRIWALGRMRTYGARQLAAA